MTSLLSQERQPLKQPTQGSRVLWGDAYRQERPAPRRVGLSDRAVRDVLGLETRLEIEEIALVPRRQDDRARARWQVYTRAGFSGRVYELGREDAAREIRANDAVVEEVRRNACLYRSHRPKSAQGDPRPPS